MIGFQICLTKNMEHLKHIKSSYLRHFVYANYYNFLGLLIVVTGFIHSVFPFVFEFTPYRLAKKIVDGVEKNFIQQESDDRP